MDCDATALTCAVLEVAEALRGGPSVLEVLLQGVGPLLLGLGTLLVAWLSFRVGQRSNRLAESAGLISRQAIDVARQSNDVAVESHRLSQQMRDDVLADRLRRERDEFVAACQEWLALELQWMQAGDDGVRAKANVLEYALLARAVTLENPNGAGLVSFMQTSIGSVDELHPSWSKTSWVDVRSQYAMRRWQRDPDDTEFESAL